MDYLSEYNPDWPAWFAEIERYLQRCVPDCQRVEHVGSTSIPGMVAKPIIDIDLVVRDGTMAAAIPAIEQAGYAHQGDLGIAGREAFRATAEITQALPPHHLYACEASSPELHRHLCFREYLSAHPPRAHCLAELKRRLALQQRLSRSEYIEAKAPLVRQITAEALDWWEAERTTWNTA